MPAKILKFLTHQDKCDLTKVTRDAIRAVGGIEAVAADTGICKTTIGNINNRFHEASIPLDLMFNIERDLEDPIFTRTLARKQGYVLISTHTEIGQTEAANLLASLGKETSEVFGSIGKAIADGEITIPEARECLSECQDMIREGSKLAKYFQKIIEGSS